MFQIPSGLDINNLIDDLRNFSWESAEILLHYSQVLKNSDNKSKIIKSKLNDEPVTLADLKVNETIIKRINENYKHINWSILSEENIKLNCKNPKIIPKWQWVLDPLDGTKDFIQRTENYAMHLALNFNNKPLLGVVLIPEKNELWITDGKTLHCEKSDGSRKKLFKPKSKKINEMKLVCSKNHKNKNLEQLVEKINFKKVNVMGSIGCKIASIIRGENDIYITLSLPGQSCPKDWDFAAPEAILRAAGGAITNLDNVDLSYNNENYEQRGIIIASNDRESHLDKCMQIKEIIKKYDLFPLDIN